MKKEIVSTNPITIRDTSKQKGNNNNNNSWLDYNPKIYRVPREGKKESSHCKIICLQSLPKHLTNNFLINPSIHDKLVLWLIQHAKWIVIHRSNKISTQKLLNLLLMSSTIQAKLIAITTIPTTD